jgi:hypothetical protein
MLWNVGEPNERPGVLATILSGIATKPLWMAVLNNAPFTYMCENNASGTGMY